MQAELAYPANRTRILQALTIITALGMALTIYLALFYAGTDTEQGNVQRIFYMHVGGFTGRDSVLHYRDRRDRLSGHA